MRRTTSCRVSLACLACIVPAIAYAHSFATPYVLPVPFWMYVYGCVAVLIVTFSVLGYFWSAPAPATRVGTWEVASGGAIATAGRYGLLVLRVGAVSCLALVIVAGFVGTGDPGRNIN